MSSSFIEYRGHGFWSDDRFTEKIVSEAAALAKAPSGEDWLNELSIHWELESSGAFAAWMHLKLDDFITDESRNARLQMIIGECMNLHAEDDPVHQTGVLLLLLLQGKVTWTDSSHLDYMVGRKGSKMPD